jgi:hypothetical protein
MGDRNALLLRLCCQIMRIICIFFLLTFIVTLSGAQVYQKDSLYTELFRPLTGGWTAGDGTISIPLPDGRILWLFGDSYLDDVRTSDTTLPCLFQVRNVVMVQEGLKFRTLLDSSQTGVQRTLFRDYPWSDTTLYWPGSGFVEKDTIYIFLGKIKNDASIANLGDYLAKMHYPDLKLLSISPLPDFNKINFGVSVLFDSASGYYYAYGVRPNWIVFEPYIGRFKLDHILDRWEYYTGSEWSTDTAKAQKISDGAMCAAYGVVKRNNTYYMISQDNGFLTPGAGRHLYAYRSSSPTGPFIGQQLLYTIEDKWKGEYLTTYNAMPHSEIYRDSLSIGYNVNGNDSTCKKDIWTERLNADCYRPKFVAIPWSIIESITKKVNSISDEMGISLYPNPANRTLKLAFSNSLMRDGEIFIFDASGHLVFQKDVPAGIWEADLDLKLLSTGSYFLEISSEGKTVQKSQFIIAK